MTHSVCRSCGQKIIWARTEAGTLMPLDFEQNKAGANLALVDGVAKVIDKGDLFAEAYSGPLYLSHFATCPEREEWRKKKAKS